MKNHLLLFLLIISSIQASAQYFQWVKTFEGRGLDGVKSITADKTGNIYIAGKFTGDVDFDPDTGTYIMKSTEDCYGDLYICKLTASGKFLRAKTIGAAQGAFVRHLQMDADTPGGGIAGEAAD